MDPITRAWHERSLRLSLLESRGAAFQFVSPVRLTDATEDGGLFGIRFG